jgi:hypothetical protein
MLRFFRSITADEAQQQSAAALQICAEQQRQASQLRQKTELLKRGPGRPKKLVDAHHVLEMAAATAALETADAVSEPSTKRRKYANWFASAYIHDILHAVQRTGSARRAVEWLQRSFPKLPTESAARFADLSESTVRSWYSDGKLRPKFQQLLDDQRAAAPRGVWRERALAADPAAEQRVKQILRTMRERGASINILVIRHVMHAILQADCPAVLDSLKLSNSFISSWAREELQYSWRTRTTAASKLPLDWRNKGVDMAKRVAYNIQVYKVTTARLCCMSSALRAVLTDVLCILLLQVHPSLVINMDQTGAHLVPSDTHTYEVKGAKDVKVIGADDKRQITACIASSLHGDLLPLQLIFQGKTNACHPDVTPAATAARVHITHSENHWSNQETMQQYVREVIVPYSEQRIAEHNLPADSHICLVLDVWSVHKSEEFRMFLRTHFPRIHLVYVPPNCTSQLQVADVILQRPFKHGLRKRFNEWAGQIIREQIDDGDVFGLNPYLKMSSIKPLILQWCIDSWCKMKDGRDYIKMGWHSCCVSLFDVHDQAKRVTVVEAASRDEFVAKAFVPEGEEGKEDDYDTEESDHEEDEEKDELDVMKERQFGTRKSARKRAQASAFGFQLNSSQLALTSDSEA